MTVGLKELSGIGVWVTRPAGQQAHLRALLAAEGANLFTQPCLALQALNESYEAQIKQVILHLDVYQHVIFVSTNAVDYTLPWIDQYWPQMPFPQSYYAIGKATQESLIKWGIDAWAANKAMNSDELLELGSLQSLTGQKCLIARGLGGREYLAEQLRKRGAQVDYCQTYRRCKPEFDAEKLSRELLATKLDYVLVNSVDTLGNLLEMIKPSVLRHLQQFSTVIAPSKRVLQACQLQGFKRVLQALNASDQAMFECLLSDRRNIY